MLASLAASDMAAQRGPRTAARAGWTCGRRRGLAHARGPQRAEPVASAAERPMSPRSALFTPYKPVEPSAPSGPHAPP
eukprot:4230618-Pyramimonas_sp.AAC.1